jgi:hypothetical protein
VRVRQLLGDNRQELTQRGVTEPGGL